QRCRPVRDPRLRRRRGRGARSPEPAAGIARGDSVACVGAQALEPGAAALLLEAPLDGLLRRLRRPAAPRDAKRLTQLRDEPLQCEVAGPPLAPPVPRDRAPRRNPPAGD